MLFFPAPKEILRTEGFWTLRERQPLKIVEDIKLSREQAAKPRQV
jgi:hypothetical protein